MIERVLAGLAVVPFLVAASTSVGGDQPEVAFTFTDAAITESSGLAVADRYVVTTNDSGDSGRVFTLDPDSGELIGTTTWSVDAVDVEALAPAHDGQVWVGDIGDNLAARDAIQVALVPVGPGERQSDAPIYDLVYPDGPHNAETLLCHPATGRLYVATKGVFGGTLYAAPPTLSPDRPNRLQPLGSVIPVATDGVFLPDGEHFVIRNYGAAVVYAFPSLEPVARFALPSQRQGEGIAVDRDGSLLISSEGLRSDVLRVVLPTWEGPEVESSGSALSAVSGVPTGSVHTPGATETPEDGADTFLDFPWLVAGALGVVAVAWGGVAALRRRGSHF